MWILVITAHQRYSTCLQGTTGIEVGHLERYYGPKRRLPLEYLTEAPVALARK